MLHVSKDALVEISTFSSKVHTEMDGDKNDGMYSNANKNLR